MNIYQEAIAKFGADHQILKAVSELNELATALMHYREGKVGQIDVASEIADVEIMISQLKLIIDPDNKIVNIALESKLNKLNKAIINQ